MHRSEVHKRQYSKNVAIAVILFALVALFFSITLVRLGGTVGP